MCKNQGLQLNLKVFFVEFLENRDRLRKSKTTRKPPEKWVFLSLAFYNAPSLDTVDDFHNHVLSAGGSLATHVLNFLFLSGSLLFREKLKGNN